MKARRAGLSYHWEGRGGGRKTFLSVLASVLLTEELASGRAGRADARAQILWSDSSGQFSQLKTSYVDYFNPR